MREDTLTSTEIGMVPLGYGKFVRAEDVVAVLPIEGEERGDRRRTHVYVAGLPAPIVASRSERAILADMRAAAALPGAAGRTIGAARWRGRLVPAAARRG